ncbi:MAG TPA: TonB-dependent receptor [Rhodanobacteraceae bacterium]|nr:TonB-dependent receptor [Rhodanobacteraceae bacterium]
MRSKSASVALGLLSASIALALATNAQAAPQESSAAAQSTQTASPASQPQTATAHKPKELETIVVTARRRSEDLEKVPIAISAFSSEDLMDMQAVDIAGLQGSVPNMNIVQGRGSSSNVNIFIRGIGQPDALQSFDPGVGFYVDDVYYSRINGALMDLFDIDHVEVLRGPQGTLYGMNSTGGAVKVVTKAPSDSPQGSVALTVGDYGRVNTQAYLSGPLSKAWSASIAAGTFKNDGDVTDPVTGRHFNNDDTQAIRGKLDFHPSDNFHADLALDYSHQNTELTMGQPTAPLESTDLALGTTTVLLQPTPWDYHAATSFGPDKGQKLIQKGAALHMDWRLNDDWSLKSITAYRKLDTAAYIDIDASPLQIGDVLVALHQHQFSQEFQLHYDNHDNVHAVFGLYYLDEHVPSHQEAYADDFLTFLTLPLDFLRTIDDNLVNKSYAAFGNGTWALGNGWSLSGGVRYTRETKDYFRTTSTFFGAPLQAFDSTFAFNDSKSWSAVTPSLVLQKQINPQTMWYVSANRGFKSGGFNGRANSPADVSTFDPEYVWTYESGIKFRSADGRARANGDVFYSNYKDFQARVSDITNPNDPIPNFSFPVLNAAKLSMYGAEFQGSMLVGASSSLQTQIGYLHAKYDEFNDPRVDLDPSLADLHAHVAFSPHWTARVAATHTFNLAQGNAITLGGDVSYRSTMWLSVDNRPGLMQPSYTLVGLFGVYDSGNGHWQVRAGVRNLTDKAYKTDAQEFSSVGNIQTAYYGWPRNYYVTARYNFF